MIQKIKNTLSVLGASATLLVGNIAVAQLPAREPGRTTIETPPGFFRGDVAARVDALLGYVLGFGALFAVIYIIWGGFDYITSAGNPEKAGAARQKIVNAVVGLIIIGLAFAIKDYAFRLVIGGQTGAIPSI